MMRSMYAGVSGLKVHQTKMDVIGNNISNVNTTGYKGGRVSFKSMMSQMIQGSKAPQDNRGGINPKQVGLGVSIGSIDNNMEQGNLQSTGMGTDLAIQGNGFFVTNDGQQNLYTRAGALSLDEDGNLVNASNGYVMQGWESDETDGTIDTNQPMENLTIPIGKSMPGQKTTEASFGGNLDGRAIGGDDRTATIDVFDSLGKKHTMSVNYTRLVSDDPSAKITEGTNEYDFTASDTTGTPSTSREDLNNLKIEFKQENSATSLSADYDPDSHTVTCTSDWSGGIGLNDTDVKNKINSALSSDFPGDPVSLSTSGTFTESDFEGKSINLSADATNDWEWEATDITDGSSITGSGIVNFDSDGTLSSGSTGTVEFDVPGGAADNQTVTLDLSNLTQSAADYSVDGTKADGYEMGSLESFTINNAGIINGTFSNGLTQALGQVAIANFSNPSGLKKEGESMFVESQNSGMPQVGTAANGGRGEISAGTLEMSNVDLSKQFTEMITTQRGFQANSKIISTTDQMLQELVNLKR